MGSAPFYGSLGSRQSVLPLASAIGLNTSLFTVFNAAQRRAQEIGVRMALGAPAPGDRGGSGLCGTSLADRSDGGSGIATLAIAGFVATYLPTRRPVKVDPARALHGE